MSWLDQNTSLYTCQADNAGRKRRVRDILFCDFAVPHEWYYREGAQWINGRSNDLTTIIDLRSGSLPDAETKRQKGTLQCWPPSAYLESKKKEEVRIIERTNILQLDFDKATCQHYDIEELKAALFDLPFVAFCSRSCTGTGFYALALIAEPERLKDYALHCFEVLEKNGLPVDTSKGSNPAGLRYVSYDANMMVKENPVPLRIKRFKAHSLTPARKQTNTPARKIGSNAAISKAVSEIMAAPVGNRFPTVQKWAFSLGGMQDESALDYIKQAIKDAAQYQGVEAKYILCAEECFKDGKLKPFNN